MPKDLDTICLKCLDKEPAARYPTAEALADDLERFVRGDPIEARPPTFGERMSRFTRRHWLTVGAGIATMLLLAMVADTAISVARDQEPELQQEALRTNS